MANNNERHKKKLPLRSSSTANPRRKSTTTDSIIIILQGMHSCQRTQSVHAKQRRELKAFIQAAIGKNYQIVVKLFKPRNKKMPISGFISLFNREIKDDEY